jgi:hypothetical protein
VPRGRPAKYLYFARGRCAKIPGVLRLRGSRLLLASSAWLTIYVACVLIVASFIVFEVLDVDGSDFPTHPAKMAARLEDAQHDDLKRPWLQQPVKLWTETVALEIRPPDHRDRDARAGTSPEPPIRKYRAGLPRAALAESAPSA